jgi:hypothetical protein
MRTEKEIRDQLKSLQLLMKMLNIEAAKNDLLEGAMTANHLATIVCVSCMKWALGDDNHSPMARLNEGMKTEGVISGKRSDSTLTH